MSDTEVSATTPEREREAALVARACSGDKAAYEALIEGMTPLLARIAQRKLSQPEDVDDVIQQTLLCGWQQIGTLSNQTSFKSWIARIATCNTLNFVRNRRQFDATDLDDVPAFTSALNTARLAAGQLWDRMGGYLDRLPPKQRLVVELRLFHELDFEEIAVLGDCTAASARVQFHLGLKVVRAAARDHDPGPSAT